MALANAARLRALCPEAALAAAELDAGAAAAVLEGGAGPGGAPGPCVAVGGRLLFPFQVPEEVDALIRTAFSRDALAWKLNIFPNGLQEVDPPTNPALFLKLEGARPLRARLEVGFLNLLSSEERFSVCEVTEVFVHGRINGCSTELSLQDFRDPAKGWGVAGKACAVVRILEVRDPTPEELAAQLAALEQRRAAHVAAAQ